MYCAVERPREPETVQEANKPAVWTSLSVVHPARERRAWLGWLVLMTGDWAAETNVGNAPTKKKTVPAPYVEW
jgi:hypothetical protein